MKLLEFILFITLLLILVNNMERNENFIYIKIPTIKKILSVLGKDSKRTDLNYKKIKGNLHKKVVKYNNPKLVYDKLISTAAIKYGLKPKLIKAVIKVESNFDTNAVSNKGAAGLMQLMPKTAIEMGVRNRFDPVQNIIGGTKYLSLQYRRFGDLKKALWAYNAGPGNVMTGYMPKETHRYIKKVYDNMK